MANSDIPRAGAIVEGTAVQAAPVDPALITLTHVIYALHSLSILIGVTSAATIIGAFVFGVPSIIAVIINYVKRDDVRGTFLESHFRWQIRTFWFAVLWGILAGLVAVVLAITLIFLLISWIPFAVVGAWVIYRIARGWLALRDRRAIAV